MFQQPHRGAYCNKEGRCFALSLRRTVTEIGQTLGATEDQILKVHEQATKLAEQGYDFVTAQASLQMLFLEEMGRLPSYFTILNYWSTQGYSLVGKKTTRFIEASVRIEVSGAIYHEAASGDGPLNALDNAFRKAVKKSHSYREIENVVLDDYVVRTVKSQKRSKSNDSGTSARVVVVVEASLGEASWKSTAVGEDVVFASWEALLQAYTFGLILQNIQVA